MLFNNIYNILMSPIVEQNTLTMIGAEYPIIINIAEPAIFSIHVYVDNEEIIYSLEINTSIQDILFNRLLTRNYTVIQNLDTHTISIHTKDNNLDDILIGIQFITDNIIQSIYIIYKNEILTSNTF